MARLKGKLVTRPDQVFRPDPRVRSHVLVDQEGMVWRMSRSGVASVDYPAFVPFEYQIGSGPEWLDRAMEALLDAENMLWQVPMT